MRSKRKTDIIILGRGAEATRPIYERMVKRMPPVNLKILKGRLGSRGYEVVTSETGLNISEGELSAWITEKGLDHITLECWRMIAANESLNNFKFATSDGEEVDKSKITEYALKMLEKWEKNVANSTPSNTTAVKINYGMLRSY